MSDAGVRVEMIARAFDEAMSQLPAFLPAVVLFGGEMIALRDLLEEVATLHGRLPAKTAAALGLGRRMTYAQAAERLLARWPARPGYVLRSEP